jgi:hypothetical protein
MSGSGIEATRDIRPAVTKGVFDRLRRGKHLLMDEKLARRAEAAAYLARHHGQR